MITYNHALYIRQAIESILIQKTNFKFVLFLFDDCSTDGTSAICQEYAERYPEKIYLHIHEKNVGASANARAIHEASLKSGAKYIAACEGDDYWTDNLKLQKQFDFLEKNPDFAICFHEVKIDNNGDIKKDYITKVPAVVTTQKDLILFDNYIHTPSILIRTKYLVFPDWFHYALPGDYPLYIIATNNGDKIYYMEEVMAHYRVHPGGTWSTGNRTKHLQRTALTLYNLGKYTHDKDRIKMSILSLAYSVRIMGFVQITPSAYYKLVFEHANDCKFTMKELFSLLTPPVRRLFGKRIHFN